jgi:hypothetical protein
MWTAVRAFEDRQALLERMASQMEARGHVRSAASFRQRAAEAATHAGVVRTTLADATSTTLQPVEDDGTLKSDSGRLDG